MIGLDGGWVAVDTILAELELVGAEEEDVGANEDMEKEVDVGVSEYVDELDELAEETCELLRPFVSSDRLSCMLSVS